MHHFFQKKRLDEKFEELTATNNFKTNKQKANQFYSKESFDKIIQEQKARIFCRNQKMGSIGPSVLIKGTLDKMHEKQEAKKSKHKN